MLVNGIMIPITVFLIERFTIRSLFLTAISLFAVGTFICAVAHGFSFLLAGSVLQALGGRNYDAVNAKNMFLIFPIENRGYNGDVWFWLLHLLQLLGLVYQDG